MNITNIDDKTIRDSQLGSTAWRPEMGEQTDDPLLNLQKLTKYYEDKFFEDLEKLGIKRKDIHGDKQFFLNGKRIVLRTTISWSFWLDNGITPSDELARRQVESAKKGRT